MPRAEHNAWEGRDRLTELIEAGKNEMLDTEYHVQNKVSYYIQIGSDTHFLLQCKLYHCKEYEY